MSRWGEIYGGVKGDHAIKGLWEEDDNWPLARSQLLSSRAINIFFRFKKKIKKLAGRICDHFPSELERERQLQPVKT